MACLSAVAATMTPARATTFTDTTVEELARASAIVVRGRVVDTSSYPVGPGGLPGIHTRVELAAHDYLVGTPVSSLWFWVQGGDHAGFRRVVAGQATFEVGEDVLVFLTEVSEGVLFPTGMARGKWSVHEAIGGGPPLARPALDLAATPRHDSASAPASVPSVTLDELRRRVRAARGLR